MAEDNPYTLQWPFPTKIAPSYGKSGPPFNTLFLRHPQVHNPNSILISSAVFAGFTAERPYILQWAAPFPKIMLLSMGGFETHTIHGSLGPPESSTQVAPLSVHPFCTAHYCDRLTMLLGL